MVQILNSFLVFKDIVEDIVEDIVKDIIEVILIEIEVILIEIEVILIDINLFTTVIITSKNFIIRLIPYFF